MSSGYDCDCRKDYHEDYRKKHYDDCKDDGSIKGNAIDIELKKCDSEVRADVVVGRDHRRCVRLWGQIKDCEGNIVEGALIKLLKPYYKNGKVEYEGVAHTTTDCLGFYQFDICPEDEKVKFRIIVSKASKGHERRIDFEEGICEPCDDHDHDHEKCRD